MNTLKTGLLMVALTCLLVFMGQLVGGPRGAVLMFVVGAGMNFVSFFFSDRIVLAMYRAREVDASHPFHAVVARLAGRAGLPMPRVYVIPDPSPNAFATGRNPQHAAVAATEGLISRLNSSELDGVIAHELAHVKHRDILISSVAATIAAAIMTLARMAQFAAMFGGGRSNDRENGGSPIALLATVILAPIAAMLIQAAISRSREFVADRGGAEIAGSPYGLVEALKKIEAVAKRVPLDANPATAHMFIMKPFSVRGVLGLFSTHPPTEARIKALLNLA